MRKLVGVGPGLAALFLCCGCGKELSGLVAPNRPPEVTVEHDALVGTATAFSYRVRWNGHDPDGRVEHFLYAVDPSSPDRVDATWTRTQETSRVLTFPRANLNAAGSNPARPAPHVFVVRSVDDRGSMSSPVFFAFGEGNLPPSVTIISPRPSMQPIIVPSTIRITWSGHDPDGVTTSRPIKYKYVLLTPSSEFPMDLAVVDPDSLRRYYAPGFVGWDSTSADTPEVVFSHLSPDQRYLFVVTGFDEFGDYDPAFSLTRNMLWFRVGSGSAAGPVISVFNEFFNMTYRGGYNKTPESYARVEAPAERTLTVNWFATPAQGVDNAGYRWVLDPDVLDDETARSDPSDVRHWSDWSLSTTSATIGPFRTVPKGEPHLLCIEARDNVGFTSLAIVQITAIGSTPAQKELLIVKDTRFRGDSRLPSMSCVEAPRGAWPTTAELDTFLFARGGVPWRPVRDATCPQGYPAGTLTDPGLFQGYSFDTLGTRTGKSDLTVPRSTLRRYRHVIWIVDAAGATLANDGRDPVSPQTALRYMSGRGRFNTLAAYVKAGGKAWLLGGGGGFATNIPWNLTDNDIGGILFSSLTQRKDLGPGRFMYDIAHWQSSFRSPKVPAVVSRYAGRYDIRENPDPTHYSRFLGELPVLLDVRTPANTPNLPPNRTNMSDYYPPSRTTPIEYLNAENRIIENVSDDLEHPALASTLDTLYRARGGGLPGQLENPANVCMTYYQGPSVPQGFVFSGLALWDFYRPHAQGVIDFVLQRMWGLQRITAAGRITSRAYSNDTRGSATPQRRPGIAGGQRIRARQR